VRKAWRKREESKAPAASPKATNVYREQHLRDLLEVSRRPEVRLTVPQVEALLQWQGTPAGDVRRLVATLDADQRLIALRNAAPQHGSAAA